MNFRQVHLDFHTSEKVPFVGKKFDKKQFQAALKAGHVNSITVFSKCHHGWAYHPSDANEMHPTLDYDLLAAQIEAAHEIGVKTPVYISAGFDEKIAVRRPDWQTMDENHSQQVQSALTNAGYHQLCMNTPYLDYLLAQIKEVCERYDADGIFLDIVGVRRCFCPTCQRTMYEMGLDPSKEEDVVRHGELVYKNYYTRVRETIDSVKPGLPVFHNGGHIRHGRYDLAFANSHLELESLPTGGWGYDHFPMSARYVQGLGMEYLGMTGKFHTSWGEFGGFKHKNALRYEAALSIANGAKCSIGDQLAPSGECDMVTYELIGEAYKEVEEKEPWLDKVTSVADIALMSNEAVNNLMNMGDDASREGKAATGAVRMLLEGHYLFDIVDTQSDLSKYKVLILADNIAPIPELTDKIREFVRGGGKLLASGTSMLNEEKSDFEFDFGVKYISESELKPDYLRPCFEYTDVGSTDYVIYSGSQKVELTTGKELAVKVASYFNRTKEHFCSHRHSPSSGEYDGCGMSEGNDGIYIAWNIFNEYAELGCLIAKRTVCYALDLLLGENKTLRTTLPAQGITTLMEQKEENRLVAHLLYAVPTPRGNGIYIIEDIVPVFGTEVSIKTDKPVKKVYLAPECRELQFKQENGVVTFTVDKFECHTMAVLEY